MQDDMQELLERLHLSGVRIADINTKIAQFATDSISCWNSPWDQPGTGQIRARLTSHPPVSLRQEVGMIVGEQRSILDALTCNLAVRNGANSTTDVYFPIMKTKAGFFEELGKRKIRKLTVADQAAIEALKPWCPPEDNYEDGNMVLFQLHEADRVRKHQKLLRWVCQAGFDPFSSGPIGMLQGGSIILQEVGKEVNVASYVGCAGPITFDFRVVYMEPTVLRGCSVPSLLSDFNKTVELIVSHFA